MAIFLDKTCLVIADINGIKAIDDKTFNFHHILYGEKVYCYNYEEQKLYSRIFIEYNNTIYYITNVSNLVFLDKWRELQIDKIINNE